MSGVREAKVIAILCSDLHLSHKPPFARTPEKDWYEVMKRYLTQLKDLETKYNCPVIIAGDLFDKWNSPPELINFAIEHLPTDVYAIPGQHDLPYHCYKDIMRSAYGTLVAAQRIGNIPKDGTYITPKLMVHGFPWGEPVVPNPLVDQDGIHLAVVHAYIWLDDRNKYEGAHITANARHFRSKLKDYHVALFGDNHKGFLSMSRNKRCHIVNTGTFIRRRTDEIDYEPRVALLYDDKTIKLHYLKTKGDKILHGARLVAYVDEVYSEMEDFVDELKHLSADPVTFTDSIRRWCDDHHINPNVRKILLESVEEKK